MTTYQSSFTGNQIDQALAKAQTALQPGEGGVQRYATVNDLPMSGVSQGTLALVDTTLQGDSAVFLWNGNETAGGWYKLATVNLAPAITSGPDAAYALPNDGTPLVLTLSAQDPEGLPVVWSYSVAAGNPAGIATVTEGPEGVFTVAADPAAVASQNGGTFSLTFTATDGVSLAGATSEFTLSFALPSRLLVVAHTTAPRLIAYDLENGLAYADYSFVSATPSDLKYISRSIAIIATAGAGANPLFMSETDGVLALEAFGHTLPGSQMSTYTGGAAASDDGRWCAVCCANAPFVAFYELVDGVPTYRPYTGTGPSDDGESVAFHPGGRWAVVSDNLSGFVVYDLSSGSPVSIGRTTHSLVGDAAHLLFSADGSQLYFTDANVPRVMAFNEETGALSALSSIPGAPVSVNELSFNSDRSWLSFGSNPPVVFDVSGGSASATPVQFTGDAFLAQSTRAVEFSADGKWVAVTFNAAPFIEVFARDGLHLTRQTLPALPTAFPAAVAFTPAG